MRGRSSRYGSSDKVVVRVEVTPESHAEDTAKQRLLTSLASAGLTQANIGSLRTSNHINGVAKPDDIPNIRVVAGVTKVANLGEAPH